MLKAGDEVRGKKKGRINDGNTWRLNKKVKKAEQKKWQKKDVYQAIEGKNGTT